jgi:hypothetical protein
MFNETYIKCHKWDLMPSAYEKGSTELEFEMGGEVEFMKY